MDQHAGRSVSAYVSRKRRRSRATPQSADLTKPDRLPRFRPSYLRMERAFYDCLDKGLAPTITNRARALNIRKQSVLQFDRRHQDFLEWLAQGWEADNGKLWGVIERRMAMIALQGSVQHADQYCKMRAGGYTKAAPNDEPVAPRNNQVVVNILVPRPQLPNGGRMPAPWAAPALPMPEPPNPSTPAAPLNPRDIPTVSIR